MNTTPSLKRLGSDGSGMCENCKTYPISRPRWLCGQCYYDMEIRVKYPKRWTKYCTAATEYHRQTGGKAKYSEGYGNSAYIPKPTLHPPGSEDKMAVMSERATAGAPIFQEGDLVPERAPLGHKKVFRIGEKNQILAFNFAGHKHYRDLSKTESGNH